MILAVLMAYVLPVLVLLVLVLQVYLLLRGRPGLEKQSQAIDGAIKDVLERIGRMDADGRDALSRRLQDFSREISEAHAAARRENAQQLSEVRKEVEAKLSETVAKNRQHFGEVASKLEKLHEVAGQMTGQFGAVAPDIRKLASALANPKGRGAYGEFSLGEILRDLLPAEFYREQYTLNGQERVDAAILLKEGVLPIDSKFTMPAVADPAGEDGAEPSAAAQKLFKQAVLERAKEISSKYIVPGKTLDFAFMYVPAESVYYRVIMDRDLHQQLLRQHVLPVSPNSLYAYLQAVGIGLKGMKLEARAKEMQVLVLQMKGDFERFGRDFSTLGVHLDNARKKYDEAQRDVTRFTDRVAHLQLGEGEAPRQIGQGSG